MKNLSIIISLLLSMTNIVNSQIINNDSLVMVKAVKEQAHHNTQSFLKKDFASVVATTYPATVKGMGGEKAMLDYLLKGAKEMEADNVSFTNVTLGEPTRIIKTEKEFQCTLSQILEMKVPGGKVFSKSTLIAISMDNGKKWYFIDTSGLDITMLKAMIPSISPDLIIPQEDKPVLIKD